MKLILDTDVCIWVVRGRAPFLGRALSHHPEELAVTAMTVAELEYGAVKSDDHAREWARYAKFLDSGVHVLPLDRDAALAHGRLRHAVRHQPIGSADLIIAAVAVARKLPLATMNVREFGRVPGLRVEDWAGP